MMKKPLKIIHIVVFSTLLGLYIFANPWGGYFLKGLPYSISGLLLISGYALTLFFWSRDKFRLAWKWPWLWATIFAAVFAVIPKGLPVWSNALYRLPALAIQEIGSSIKAPGEIIWAILAGNSIRIGRIWGWSSFESVGILCALLVGLYVLTVHRLSKDPIFAENRDLVFWGLIIGGVTPAIAFGMSSASLGALLTTVFIYISLHSLSGKTRENAPVVIIFGALLAVFPYSFVFLIPFAYVLLRHANNAGFSGARKVIYVFSNTLLAFLPAVFLFWANPPAWSELWDFSRFFSLSSWGDTLGMIAIMNIFLVLIPILIVLSFHRWERIDDKHKFLALSATCFIIGLPIISLDYGRFDWILAAGLAPVALVYLLSFCSDVKYIRKVSWTFLSGGFIVFMGLVLSNAIGPANANWVKFWVDNTEDDDWKIARMSGRLAEYNDRRQDALDTYIAAIQRFDRKELKLDLARMLSDSDPARAISLFDETTSGEEQLIEGSFGKCYVQVATWHIDEAYILLSSGLLEAIEVLEFGNRMEIVPFFRLEQNIIAFKEKEALPDNDLELFALYFHLLTEDFENPEYIFASKDREFVNKLYMLIETQRARLESMTQGSKATGLRYESTGNQIADQFVFAAALNSVKGNMDDAIVYANKAIEYAPDYAPVYYVLGYGMHLAGEFDSAKVLYEKTIERDPEFASAHNNLGIILAGQKDLETAIGHLRSAVELRPDVPDYRLNLGGALYVVKDYSGAIIEYEEYLRLAPDAENSVTIAGEIEKIKIRLSN